MYKIKKGIVNEKIGKKLVIFDSEKSVLYNFNETARLIFEKLKKGLDKKIIIDLLVKKYEIDKKTAKKDLDKTIKFFLREKIISVSKKIK